MTECSTPDALLCSHLELLQEKKIPKQYSGCGEGFLKELHRPHRKGSKEERPKTLDIEIVGWGEHTTHLQFCENSPTVSKPLNFIINNGTQLSAYCVPHYPAPILSKQHPKSSKHTVSVGQHESWEPKCLINYIPSEVQTSRCKEAHKAPYYRCTRVNCMSSIR
jgi:hypothetical protein